MGAFDWQVVWASLPYLAQGLGFTVQLTAVALAGGLVLGTLLALARISGPRPLALAAAAYVNIMRSVPLVMVILWFFLVIPMLTGRPLGTEASALVTFTAFEAAYYGEIIRAGIQSIPRGQVDAARALGLTRAQATIHVVLPQAVRNMAPVLLTQTIILFQDTSLVHAIGAKDLLKAAEIAGKNYNRPVEMYVFVAAVYFAICLALSLLVRRLRRASGTAAPA
ncbi:MAG: amino acid ABC transporter permease [Rhodocyclaceae bacterium]|nr:amino acid ABC transporter permease [Rhodocyclaceae bacterium]